MKRLPYSEGAVFLVPLSRGGHARGVVARSGKGGKILFGYFFGPRILQADTTSLCDLMPSKAILRVHFGDLGLIKGEWPVVGQLPDWNRSEWPIPDFVRREDFTDRAWRVHYSDDDPSIIESECPTDFHSPLDDDSLYGYGAVEGELDDKLAEN